MVRNLKVAYKPSENYPTTPMIRIASQKYLRDICGFRVGDKLAVEYFPNRVVIERK